MKQIGGGKDCALTRGGLTDMPGIPGNPSGDGRLNRQESAEAIVPTGYRLSGRAEQSREDKPPGFPLPALTAEIPKGPA